MAETGESKEPFSYEVIKEGNDNILSVECENYIKIPSIEDDPITMGKTCDILLEVPNVTKIIFYQKRNYEYDFPQVILLLEISKIYNQLVKNKDIVSYNSLIADPSCMRYVGAWYAEIRHIVSNLLRTDPLGAYVELKRIHRREKIWEETVIDPNYGRCEQRFISVIAYLAELLEKTKLVTIAKSFLSGYKLGDREIYRRIFKPTVKPDFMFTKLMATYPIDAEEIDDYLVGNDTEVTIFEHPDSVQYIYHMIPPEFKLSEEEYDILDTARKILAEHKPKSSEFVDPERMRQVFYNVGSDLIEELLLQNNLKSNSEIVEKLTKILVRYTVGFGLIEVLLQDDRIQDITINSPVGNLPMFIVHRDYDECKTNIIPTMAESESWASKLKLISGRPLDEANPILDTELIIPGADSRVSVISPPLNPTGLAYAFRRHRDKPWTLPLFMKNGMISSLGAGVLSFIIDGSRTMLIAGTRSAGKTSLLGSIITEIMQKYRIITIEDTLELPCSSFRKLGYNIQSMKVASAMTRGTAEVSAEEGIRTTLRMGDSCLIVGEVRSVEAKALYEAMRVGALANVVAGTIHGDSPYGVFDRVVNDLNVPRTSFKATDIIVVANPIRSADGMHRWRRITQITEVRKHWEQDPLLEHGFVDLLKYDTKTDMLEPTPELIDGESEVIKSIAGNIKEWAGNWDAIWENISLRTKLKENLLTISEKSNNPELIEAPFVIKCNDEYHRLADKIKEEVGSLDSKRIEFEWNEWLKRQVKKNSLE